LTLKQENQGFLAKHYFQGLSGLIELIKKIDLIERDNKKINLFETLLIF